MSSSLDSIFQLSLHRQPALVAGAEAPAPASGAATDSGSSSPRPRSSNGSPRVKPRTGAAAATARPLPSLIVHLSIGPGVHASHERPWQLPSVKHQGPDASPPGLQQKPFAAVAHRPKPFRIQSCMHVQPLLVLGVDRPVIDSVYFSPGTNCASGSPSSWLPPLSASAPSSSRNASASSSTLSRSSSLSSAEPPPSFAVFAMKSTTATLSPPLLAMSWARLKLKGSSASPPAPADRPGLVFTLDGSAASSASSIRFLASANSGSSANSDSLHDSGQP
mmetsp:Transcript_115402/g.326984  ORF Transcript_115402/g.326984 Transcript_115402/m.326984 type:complete len:277 (-) Transcript_115402:405-1235(-)